jgi:hypothetical protein
MDEWLLAAKIFLTVSRGIWWNKWKTDNRIRKWHIREWKEIMAKPRKEKESTETGSKRRNGIFIEEEDHIRRGTQKQIYDDGEKKRISMLRWEF